MTNEQFWKKLDKIAGKQQTAERIREFVEILKQGYYQGLDILILGVENANDTFNQNCVLEGNNRIMLYFTSRKHAENNTITVPAIVIAKPKCIQADCRTVIDNALNKDSVEAIAFNYDSKYPYIIPKILLLIAFAMDADRFGMLEE